MNYKIVYVLVFLFCLESSAIAQQPTKLALPDAIQNSLQNNKTIQQKKLDQEKAKNQFSETQAFFLPQVQFSYTAFKTNNPLNAFGFKLQQQNVTAADFNPVVLNNPGGTSNVQTQIQIQQPLINVDLLYKRKAASLQTEIKQWIVQRTQEHITLEVQKAYLNLQMLYAAETILKQALQTTKAFKTNADNYFTQGLLQKSDALYANMQVIQIENEIQKNNFNIQDASDVLNLLMGVELGNIYKPDTLTKESNNLSQEFKFNPNRSDFIALTKGIESLQQMIKSEKTSMLPKLNAFSSFQINNAALFSFNTPVYMAGIQLSWNLFNANQTKHKVQQQELEKENIKLQLHQQQSEAQLQINIAVRSLQDASFQQQKNLLAIEQSEEALRIIQNRFQQGLLKTTEVLEAQTKWSQAKLQYVQSIFQYNLALAQLNYLITQ